MASDASPTTTAATRCRSRRGRVSTVLAVAVGVVATSVALAVSARPGSAAAERAAAPHGIIHTDAPVQSFTRNFNPFSPTSLAVGMYEPLMIANPVTNKIVPWLATSYDWSKSLRVLTFALRPGVEWSDGKAFTAADVAFTFNMLHGHPALGGAQVWNDGLKTVKAIGRSKVQFTFAKPFTPAIYAIFNVPIVPKHGWSG